MIRRVLELLSQAVDGAGFLNWGQVSADKILGKSKCGLWGTVGIYGRRRDGRTTQQSMCFQATASGNQSVVVFVTAHGNGVDQPDACDAVGEFLKCIRVEGKTVVGIVVGIDQVEGDGVSRHVEPPPA